MIVDEWIEVKLGDICDFQKGFAFKSKDYQQYGRKIIKVSNLNNYNIDTSECVCIDESKTNSLHQFQLKKDDIIITTVGSWPANPNSVVGKVIKVQQEAEKSLLNQNAVRVRGLSKINQKYLYYILKRKEFFDYILGTAQGAANQASITQNDIKNFQFSLPSLYEQKAIADTLTCLDDKIELHNRINKTLEEMAQAIFKSWFVDFEPFQDGEFEESELGLIPKGWRIGKLGEIANITMGQSPKGTSYNEEKKGKVFYQGRTDFGVRFPKIRLYTTEPKRMADIGDVLLSVRAPVGDINVASENCCIGRGLATLKSKNYCNSFLLYQLINLKESFNVYNGEGTVFGSINKDTLNNMRVLIPKENCIQDFQNTVEKIDEILENNSNEIKTLTTILNSLLPKLMSGEIRVPLAELTSQILN